MHSDSRSAAGGAAGLLASAGGSACTRANATGGSRAASGHRAESRPLSIGSSTSMASSSSSGSTAATGAAHSALLLEPSGSEDTLPRRHNSSSYLASVESLVQDGGSLSLGGHSSSAGGGGASSDCDDLELLVSAAGGAAGSDRVPRYTDNVVHELLETERAYVHDLSVVIQGYQRPMRECGVAEGFISETDLSILFGSLEAILKFNSEFLDRLINECSSGLLSVNGHAGSYAVAIAECFLTHFGAVTEGPVSEAPGGLEVYASYCTNYPRSLQVLARLGRAGSRPRALLARLQLALGHRMHLGSYLLKPVQRILKYPLLLDAMRHFEKDYPGVPGQETIERALKAMQHIANRINEIKKLDEDAVRVQEIESVLQGWPGDQLATYGGLIAEERVAYEKKHMMHIFLFEKMLLITKRKRRSATTLCYVQHIATDDLMVNENRVIVGDCSFQVMSKRDRSVMFLFETTGSDRKKFWCDRLNRVILDSLNITPEQRTKILDNLRKQRNLSRQLQQQQQQQQAQKWQALHNAKQPQPSKSQRKAAVKGLDSLKKATYLLNRNRRASVGGIPQVSQGPVRTEQEDEDCSVTTNDALKTEPDVAFRRPTSHLPATAGAAAVRPRSANPRVTGGTSQHCWAAPISDCLKLSGKDSLLAENEAINVNSSLVAAAHDVTCTTVDQSRSNTSSVARMWFYARRRASKTQFESQPRRCQSHLELQPGKPFYDDLTAFRSKELTLQPITPWLGTVDGYNFRYASKEQRKTQCRSLPAGIDVAGSKRCSQVSGASEIICDRTNETVSNDVNVAEGSAPENTQVRNSHWRNMLLTISNRILRTPLLGTVENSVCSRQMLSATSIGSASFVDTSSAERVMPSYDSDGEPELDATGIDDEEELESNNSSGSFYERNFELSCRDEIFRDSAIFSEDTNSELSAEAASIGTSHSLQQLHTTQMYGYHLHHLNYHPKSSLCHNQQRSSTATVNYRSTCLTENSHDRSSKPSKIREDPTGADCDLNAAFDQADSNLTAESETCLLKAKNDLNKDDFPEQESTGTSAQATPENSAVSSSVDVIQLQEKTSLDRLAEKFGKLNGF